MKMRLVLLMAALALLGATTARSAAPADSVEELNFYNTDLHLVLKALAEKTGRTFVEDVPVEGKVTVHISSRTSIAEVLDQILRGLNLSWRMEKDVYHVSLRLPPKGMPLGKGLVSKTFSLTNIPADEAAESVRPILSEYGKVVTDYWMNAVTVTDVGEIQASVRALLEGLDVAGKRAPQVNIQIKVLQVDRTDTNDTSAHASWHKYNASQAVGSNFNDPLNNTKGWGQQADGWQSWSGDSWDSWIQQDEYFAYYPQGVSFKTGHWGIDQVMLRMFASVGTDRLNLLSEPDVTVLDGTEAKILLGEKLPLKTSGGGFQYTDTGIILKVKPKVGENGEIALELNPQITDRSAETFRDVNFLNTREVVTQVEVMSGGTVRIGGLLMTQAVRTETKIPVLGDLPILGMLFKNSSTRNTKQELVVLVSPHLVERIPPRCATTAGISALKANLMAGTSDVQLDWAEDVPFDNVGVVRYHIFRDIRPITTTAGMPPLTRDVSGDVTSWVDRTFKRRGTTYYYAVTAVDGGGNEQAVSNSPSVAIPRR